VRRKFKPLAHSAKCFLNFTSQNFKILTKPNLKSMRSQILKFYRSKILKFRVAEFPLSFHKRYILKFCRSRRLKIHAVSKLLKSPRIVRPDQIKNFARVILLLKFTHYEILTDFRSEIYAALIAADI